MKFRLVILAIIVLTLSCAMYVVSAQQSDEEVRGVFLSSRPKTTNPNPPPRRRHQPPRNQNTSAAKNTNTARNTNASVVNVNAAVSNKNSSNAPVQAIALGYTMFMRDVNGRAVRIDPTREFHNGDRIRISLEPNIDGYLYVFHIEGDGQPEMIFPDARLEGGENWVEAHVPLDVPSNL